MNALEISKLIKCYEGFTLEIPRLTLPEGCVMGLIGENGAGKSTTLRLILNAIGRDAGTINVLGHDNAEPDFNMVKQQLGVVLDEAHFPDVLNARQVSRIMSCTYADWHEAQFDELLRRFDIPMNKQFKEFSRGMRMKLAIAVALAHDAKLLLLDEPTGGLDPIVRDEILELFYEFTRDPTHSILISSHIVSDLEKLCDMIAFLHRGKLVFCETMDELEDKYALVKCGTADFARIDPAAVVGQRRSQYGVEALVLRGSMPDGFVLERAGVEDIMLYTAKGESVQ